MSRPQLSPHCLAFAIVGLVSVIGIAGCQATSGGKGHWPQPAEAVYRHAAVAADHPVASEAGAEMLAKGGNAVDAAVAASFALSVVRPYSCGIGGGGFMVIAMPAEGDGGPELVALDYRETAPASVGPDYYVHLNDELASRYGVQAAGVPGTVAGLLHALEHYGALDRATVLAPAIRAAEEGVPADASHVSAAKELADTLADHPELRAIADPIWRNLCRGGKVKVGDLVRHPDQAGALRLIAAYGADAFYHGPIADAIVSVMERNGGPITREDLAGYQVDVVTPLIGHFGEYQIVSMPPPSSGGVAILQILGILDRRRDVLDQSAHNSPGYVHLLTEAMKHAFADRATWLADPAFVDVPVDQLLDPAYLDHLAASIDLNHTGEPSDYGSAAQLREDGGTSHLSVIDSSGMAVACTETINLGYGSLVVVPGFGFALNNEMDDFTTIPGQPNAFGLEQSDRNLPTPGKRPLSSMSPTIVMKDGRVILIVGGSGGPRIITGTLQVMLNCLLFDMTPAEAVSRARFHHQWMPDSLSLEEVLDDEAGERRLRGLGHDIDRRKDVGVVQVITTGQAAAGGVAAGERGLRAAADPRKGGGPAGF